MIKCCHASVFHTDPHVSLDYFGKQRERRALRVQHQVKVSTATAEHLSARARINEPACVRRFNFASMTNRASIIQPCVSLMFDE